MFTLSSDPILQQIQLKELVNTSVRVLAELTSPIILFNECETHRAQPHMYRDNLFYQPPNTRYGKFGNTRHGGLNFDN